MAGCTRGDRAGLSTFLTPVAFGANVNVGCRLAGALAGIERQGVGLGIGVTPFSCGCVCDARGKASVSLGQRNFGRGSGTTRLPSSIGGCEGSRDRVNSGLRTGVAFGVGQGID